MVLKLGCLEIKFLLFVTCTEWFTVISKISLIWRGHSSSSVKGDNLPLGRSTRLQASITGPILGSLSSSNTFTALYNTEFSRSICSVPIRNLYSFISIHASFSIIWSNSIISSSLLTS